MGKSLRVLEGDKLGVQDLIGSIIYTVCLATVLQHLIFLTFIVLKLASYGSESFKNSEYGRHRLVPEAKG